MKREQFFNFLRILNRDTGEAIFVFRVPFLEKDALDNVRKVLNDVFTIRTLPFVPFSTNELITSARNILEKKNFSLTDGAVTVYKARIAEEKSDGKFYGIKTVQKIAREMIYLKLLKNSEEKTNDTRIRKSDILQLTESFSSDDKSGVDCLNELIGLDELKQRILEIVAQIEASQKNNKLEIPSIHMRFTGNPGTGKTTVARILGQILKEKGILRNGNFFEYMGRDFCGRYIGETAPKTSSMCRDAYGSVLFIDEAYSLYNGADDGRDYGREALATLVSEMENHRNDLLVIMAGYSDEMDKLLKGNPGLESRMPFTLEFPNYEREDLSKIFLSMAENSFTFDKTFIKAVETYFISISEDVISSDDFSNARFVRNLFERTWGKAILREQFTDSNEISLKVEDFQQAVAEGEFKAIMEKKVKKVGFF